MTVSGSTVALQMQPQQRRTSAWMTTGGGSTRRSLTSMSPWASSQMPLNSKRMSLISLDLAVAHLHLHFLTILTEVSCSQLLAAARHQSPSLGSPQSTLQPPLLRLRMTMQPQTVGNPYNWPETSTVVPLLQVVMLIDSSGFMQSFATPYISGNSVLRLVNGAVQVVLDPHVTWRGQHSTRWQCAPFSRRLEPTRRCSSPVSTTASAAWMMLTTATSIAPHGSFVGSVIRSNIRLPLLHSTCQVHEAQVWGACRT